MKEKLSAMLDGDVDDATARALFTRLKHDPAFRDEWDTYCLVGDIIRGYVPPEREGFSERVMARLENEPIIFAPSGGRKNVDETGVEEKAKAEERAKAEEKAKSEVMHHFWHNRLLPLAASVMGVLVVGGGMAMLSRDAPAPEVASVLVVETPGTVPVVAHSMENGARHDYLVAHQALAGGPMPAVQYVRTVSISPRERD
ncbi:MAG: sigma-E factor negative regulatory protein [Azoarcus sp.]|nr:sigma-E factor negative regulatory protein [Azoarcus sp.]